MQASEKQSVTPVARPMRWSLEEYHQLVDAGILRDRKVELIQGNLLEMPPEGPEHTYKTASGADYLRQCVSQFATVREAHPVTLASSEPEPDLAVVKGSHEDYKKRHPNPDDIYLLVEIAQSTLSYDLGYKQQVYATAGVQEYWVIDVVGHKLHIFQQPSAEGYRNHVVLDKGAITLLALPNIAVDVERLLR